MYTTITSTELMPVQLTLKGYKDQCYQTTSMIGAGTHVVSIVQNSEEKEVCVCFPVLFISYVLFVHIPYR